MKEMLPEAFIQIHYHLRAGGVSTVVKSYADAFSQCCGINAENYIICSSSGQSAAVNGKNIRILNIENCEYKTFTTREQFTDERDNLYNAIDSALCGIKTRNAAVVGHNLVLAKNPALASAFRLLACKWSECGFRFFSVVHDFAEEGRADQLDQIRLLKENDVDIVREIYCVDAPVNFIVLNEKYFKLLNDNGFYVTLLPNPVSTEMYCQNDKLKKKIRESLLTLAFREQCRIDPCKLMYYPVRLISRKNIYEAIALCCIAYEYSLLCGPSGSSNIDRQRYVKLLAFIKKNRLPVLPDSARFTDEIPECKYHPVESIMNISNIIVSTSVSEGFGYSFFDPWIHGKALISRRPSGYMFPDSWNLLTSYSRFPVPSDWISISELDRMYNALFERCYGKRLKWDVESSFVLDGTVDFAVLSESMQISLLDTVFNDSGRMNEWKSILRENMPGWPGSITMIREAADSIDRHGELIRREFCGENFSGKFIDCFSKIPQNVSASVNIDRIMDFFQSSSFFRLLLTGQI